MPRIPRKLIVQEGHPVHKVWRGHNREWNLKTDFEKSVYLRYMFEEHGTEDEDKTNPVHAVCLMSNHSHEVIHIDDQPTFSKQMRRHHARYGQFFNNLHSRTGKVAQDRAKTGTIGDHAHAMMVTFYVHANPVRAKMVKDAKDYVWSTHKLYAFGIKPRWFSRVVWPEWYLALGSTFALRRRKYRQLFDAYLKENGLKQDPTMGRPFIGDLFWKMQLEAEVTKWRRGISTHDPPDPS